ncbi:hypothetical protein CLI92_11615 [Vandammella animalimorsus]|uniref:Teneurin-like YD-shell domain-containing protein n=1 Tax=Vandammella animalimorsus TaxID=2029117 RepID=A0A2A2T2X8_9BURK|nr:RHS repeat-associated core domain-containing protein [Vandammella animalimorsus]PAT31425.1 hypothetical protein CK626_09895 [Vandammella animalimorsus]PAX15825.1 hypothetical protein CLI92_11615 [Vandammella animalimorsus]PAX17654.1 hypothetical protein CLI93_12600 [Vandammella animalimorsus]
MDGQRTEWAYDANGNRSHENGLPIASYDAQDRLLAWKDNQYTYTPAGDLLTRTSPQGQTRYQYDAQGNLRQVLLPGGQRIDYDIDPLNRRIGKRKNGQVQYRLLFLDKLHPLAEFDQQGNIRSLFVYADRSNAPTLMLRGGKTWRLIADHLGSIRLVIDAETGQIGQRIDYDAWGRVTHDSQPGFQPFGFAGGLYDPDTGLTRFGARDYDAETGRWTAKDPILFNGGDSNLYGYVLQDPVNGLDPMGTGPWDKLYGLPKEFWHWFHRLDGGKEMQALKDPKTKMVPEEDARTYFQEWQSIQKKQKGGIESIGEMLMPWFLYPRELACSTMDCHYRWDPCNKTWIQKD